MEWLKLLPPELARVAYRAGAEAAWSRADAIRVVEFLKARGYVVLGVDIWLPTRPGPTIPTPFVYDWSSDSAASRPDEFIRNFRWADLDEKHHGIEPFFNITATRHDS
jgi:hypothetical protein